ncbi:uncharacterized protein E0L32_012312 [Thyridium curvatum]|uniref:Uncharacterized protein n=1 Tax=Thyridium curvatum TaxID=1093900 RepID=A0A507B1Q5_9PEZI|nr:uncharacterized protein E0L32_012312 [Thyridium curvatum]TPX17035.1 hypothetical protein E0L32_012312 [Thyridium curvatum]
MPLASGQKGTGKKNAGSIARQRSRNTTPSSIPPTASLPPIETVETEYLDLKFELFRNITYEDIIDSAAASAIPDSRSLDGTLTRLQRLLETVEQRGTYYDRGMRLLAQNRKTRMDEMAAERGREEERLRREADDEERERRANKKKRKAPDHPSAPSGKTAGSPNAMDVDRKDKGQDESDSDSSSDDGRPPPRPVPQNQTFGEDPSTFPDPTVYDIKPVEPGMTEDEIKAIYSVAVYPRSDLADLIAGDPPDKDFSSAKPSNQISFSTFSTYIEPYFRPFTEEDLGFLRERGDRVQPFVMPRRGDKHYLDRWAEEDGGMAIDTSPTGDKLAPNQPRGTIENMDDELAETDKLSVGPLLSRLLQAMRPESRATPSEDRPTTNGVHNDSFNGDISMNGADPFTDTPTNGAAANGTDEKTMPPATLMAESATDAWKKASHPKLDYSQVDERIKQELRHIGFLPGATANGGTESGAANGAGNANNTSSSGEPTADYDGHYDDEVAARLRLLQARLREQVLLNGARKARLAELVKERMAHQEYQTILEDLDTQVQAAYLKRTRTMGKSKKGKRPGAAAAGGAAGAGGAGAGMARPGIGDLTKTLMERRRRWIENIGTVFDEDGAPGKVPRASDPDSSIFKPAEMAGLVKKEKEAWDEEVEEVE